MTTDYQHHHCFKTNYSLSFSTHFMLTVFFSTGTGLYPLLLAGDRREGMSGDAAKDILLTSDAVGQSGVPNINKRV